MIDPAVQPNEVSIQITDPGGDNPGPEAFKLVVKRNGQVVEEYDNAQLGQGQAERGHHGQRSLEVDQP